MNTFLLAAGSLLSAACLAIQAPVYAQRSRLHADLSVLRFGSEIAVDRSTVYSRLMLLNAVKLGYTLPTNGSLRAGIRRQPGRYIFGKGNSIAKMDNKGWEASAGYEQAIRIDSVLCLLPEIGMFYDYAHVQGVAQVQDMLSMLPVDHTRQYVGIYPELKAAYRLSKHFSLLAGARLRIGYVTTSYAGAAPAPAFQPSEGMSVTFDPTSTVSFRYHF